MQRVVVVGPEQRVVRQVHDERLRRVQGLGVLATLGGVVLLSAG